MVLVKRLFAAFQFILFSLNHRIDLVHGNSQPINDRLIQDTNSTAGDGTDGEFFVLRRAEFSHEKNIKRRVKCASDFKTDWHTATGKREHNNVRAIRIRLE